MILCHDWLSWFYAMIYCHDSMPWFNVMILCHDLWFCLLEGYCAHFYILFSFFMILCHDFFFMILCHDSFYWYPSPSTMVRSQHVGMLTDTDLLPRQISFLPWLEALSIYCLIEKFCQLIDLFEFTEFLIFWFVLQNKLKFENILWKILVSATSLQRQSVLDTAVAHLALHQCPTY